MRHSRIRLWIHLIIILAIVVMVAAGCEEEETAIVTPVTPAPTESIGEPIPTEELTPTPTEEVSPTETADTVPTSEPIPTEELTPTPTEGVSPTETADPVPTSEPEITEEAPPLPPPFGIDLDAFTSSSSSNTDSDVTAQGFVLASYDSSGVQPFTQAGFLDRTHWNHASGNVLIFGTIIVVGLAVPVAAFVASFQNIPYKDNGGDWIWSYDVNIAGVKHSAELHGRYVADGTEWEMIVSKEGHYSDFAWYKGEANLAVTEGHWIMQESPVKQNDFLRIDWERNPADKTGEIKYTNIIPNGPENGGYILTRTTNGATYNSYWDIYNKGKDNHTIIEWSTATEKGRVKDTKKFGNDQWHCWDTNHDNIDCP